MASVPHSSNFDPSFDHDDRPVDGGYQNEARFMLQGRYEVVSLLGQGGMGTVYMARDLRLANRYCVVKKLRDDFFREEDKQRAQSFFAREANVLSRLQHSNIVHILDYFQENGDYYFVMEYVEGENLHQMLTKRGEPFPEEQVLQWASEIADVLQFLHNNDPKVIYRDLKPSNIMIDTKDRVKLVDFGIARPYEDSDNTHVVSAGYSPPEQYWGAADPRSDIYALGATMYFLLTGQEPLALQVCSPKKVVPTISDQADEIVQRATQQDVWLRYQTAPEMKAEIDWKPPVKTPSNRARWIETGFLVVAAIAIAGFGMYAAIKMSNLHKDADKTADSGSFDSSVLKKKDQAYEKLRKQFEAQAAKLRQYQQSTKVAAVTNTAPKVAADSPQPVDESVLGPSPAKNAPSTVKPRVIGVAFKESDEAQLTDPDGLAPLEEDSQTNGMKFPFMSGKSQSLD